MNKQMLILTILFSCSCAKLGHQNFGRDLASKEIVNCRKSIRIIASRTAESSSDPEIHIWNELEALGIYNEAVDDIFLSPSQVRQLSIEQKLFLFKKLNDDNEARGGEQAVRDLFDLTDTESLSSTWELSSRIGRLSGISTIDRILRSGLFGRGEGFFDHPSNDIGLIVEKLVERGVFETKGIISGTHFTPEDARLFTKGERLIVLAKLVRMISIGSLSTAEASRLNKLLTSIQGGEWTDSQKMVLADFLSRDYNGEELDWYVKKVINSGLGVSI